MRINGGGWETASVVGTRNGLAVNTLYTFELRACNDVGCGRPSALSRFTTYGPPTTPGFFSSSTGSVSITWSWGLMSTSGSPNRYELRYEYDGIPRRTIRLGESSSYTVDTEGWVEHRAQVRACNDLGCSSWSEPNAVTLIPPTAFWIATGDAAGCGNYCNHLRINGAYMRPNHTYTIRCFGPNGQFDSHTLRADDIGGAETLRSPCIYATFGDTLYITATDGFGVRHTSPTFDWHVF